MDLLDILVAVIGFALAYYVLGHFFVTGQVA